MCVCVCVCVCVQLMTNKNVMFFVRGRGAPVCVYSFVYKAIPHLTSIGSKRFCVIRFLT